MWPGKRPASPIAGASFVCRDITDGASNTYLAGEKYLDPDYYTTGQDGSDNEFASLATTTTSSALPFRRAADEPAQHHAHQQLQPVPAAARHARLPRRHWVRQRRTRTGFNMAFCDGSVHTLNFSIDFGTHCRLCNRKDGYRVDPGRIEPATAAQAARTAAVTRENPRSSGRP